MRKFEWVVLGVLELFLLDVSSQITSNNNIIKLETSGSQRILLDQNGKVLLGQGSAAENLTIEGSMMLKGTTGVTGTSSYGKIYFNSSDNKLYSIGPSGNVNELSEVPAGFSGPTGISGGVTGPAGPSGAGGTTGVTGPTGGILPLLGNLICPNGFSILSSNGYNLGCIQTDEQGTGTLAFAADNCFDNFGARLPSNAELNIAYNNASLINDAEDFEWTNDIGNLGTGSKFEGYMLKNTSNFDFQDVTTSQAFRCFIPPGSHQGPQGSQGPNGATGPVGPTGGTGPTGPSPQAEYVTSYLTGDQYITSPSFIAVSETYTALEAASKYIFVMTLVSQDNYVGTPAADGLLITMAATSGFTVYWGPANNAFGDLAVVYQLMSGAVVMTDYIVGYVETTTSGAVQLFTSVNNSLDAGGYIKLGTSVVAYKLE